MEDWSPWFALDEAEALHGPFAFHGIYQIRCTNPTGSPIPIPRLVGADNRGILYIGRSGLPSKSPDRTVANRLAEFSRYQHSGGKTYLLASLVMSQAQLFRDYSLEARAKRVPESDIERTEDQELSQYLLRHGELPPCNSKMPAVKRALYGKSPKWSA